MEQRVLGGRYLLKDKVGTGGMATVYRAQDQTLDRTVAVKIMLPQYASDATFAARFKQEAQAAAGLSSPYIVGVYDWGKDGDTYYIVMEYLRGTDLKSGIRSHGALDPKKVAQIGSQICGALSVAHNHEIIHRDIKPQNIMVLPDGNIKVMDFGIARAKNSHLTQDNNVLGTAHYVSPEQTRGQELGPTSDLYSLGVVMYECATGRVPFDGDDAISVAMKQVSELPVPPSQINPNVDANLERIILKCMEKDPANRFQSAEELRSVLNNYLAGATVNVGDPTRVINGGSAAAGAGATATKVMTDATTAMARPAVQTTNARPISASTTGSYAAEKKKGGKGKIIAAVIAVLAIIGVAAAVALNMMGSSNTGTVPNVLGYEQAAAEKAVEKAGFDAKIEQSYSDDVDEGKVMEQTPDGDTEKEKGSTVTLVISKGAKPVEKITVPNLVGESSDAAKKALEDLGLVASSTEEASSTVEKGNVISQETAAGTQVDKGTTIKYVVSSGPDTTVVPDVRGYSKSDAASTLQSYGFVVSYDYSQSDSVAEGLVISQDPSQGYNAVNGATVTIVISTGSGKLNVPNITGYSVSQATNAVAVAGFNYWLVDTDGNTISDQAEGTVVSYSPTTAVAGDTVQIVIQLSSDNTMDDGNDSGITDPGNTAGGNVMNEDNY